MSDLPQTERANPQTLGLDRMPVRELVSVLAQQQRAAAEAVSAQANLIAAAAEEVAKRLRNGGRLHYVGAGTSGRLGFLDAAEMPPTFGTKPELICAHIAGGRDALTRAVEGAEDDGDAGEREMMEHVARGDAVVGVSASGGAPYVVRAIAAARRIGAWTAGVSNNDASPLLAAADLAIWLDTGPEPIAGSTRLKAGTSQKIFLNTLSSATMVLLGKVFDNLMVDVVATNNKLRDRARRLVMQLAPTDAARAQALLSQANGSVKIAVLMARLRVDADAARTHLAATGGSLRVALEGTP